MKLEWAQENECCIKMREMGWHGLRLVFGK
jgi:hypothetical protein